MRTFFKHPPVDAETLSDEVFTIPDDALTVRDILSRYTRSHLDSMIESGEDDDIDSPDIAYDDFVDAQIDASRISEIESSLRAVPEESAPVSDPPSDPSAD